VEADSTAVTFLEMRKAITTNMTTQVFEPKGMKK
jgi:hypothetical protein